MNKTEAMRVAEFAKGCFRFMTVQQGEIIFDELMKYEALTMERGIAVVKQHHKEHAELDMPNLLLSLRNCVLKHVQYRLGVPKSLRRVDWIRQTNSAKYGQATTDISVIVDHFGAAWRRVLKDCQTSEAIAVGRRFIYADCRNALAEIGCNRDEVEDIASAVIDKEPGAPIRLPVDLLPQQLDEATASMPAHSVTLEDFKP